MIKVFNHYLSIRLLLLTLLEAAVLFQSVIIGFQIRFPENLTTLPHLEAGVFTFIMLMAMSALGLYQTHAEPFRTTVHRVLIAYGLSLLLISAVFYVFPETYIGRGVMAWSSLFALISVLLLRALFFRVTEIGLPKRRVMVLGNGSEAEEVIRFLHNSAGRHSIEYAGLYPVMPERDAHGNERLLDQFMAPLPLNIGNKADTTGITLFYKPKLTGDG
jgi:FlaA1/EpsC-like NDP-sugar epimerase